MQQLTREHMEAYYQTYNSEDPEALKAFYADDVVLISSEGEQRGVDSILDTYRYLISVFHDKMTPMAIRVNGNSAEVDIIDRFTAKVDVDDFLGMALSAGDSFELALRGTYAMTNNGFSQVVVEQLKS